MPLTTSNFNMETIETAILKGRVKLLQPKDGFHASLDSMLLSASVECKSSTCKILDMGCGVGTVGLCIASRAPQIKLTGIDIQPELIEIAKKNAKLNNIDAEFVCGNITNKDLLENNHFCEIVMNPPYHDGENNAKSPNKIKATSHNESLSNTTLEDWIKFAHMKLQQGGGLTIIHKAERLDEIISTLVKRRWFGGLIVFPIHSHFGDDAKRVIVRARKERYTKMRLKSGIITHNEDGTYSDAAEAILSDAECIDWSIK